MMRENKSSVCVFSLCTLAFRIIPKLIKSNKGTVNIMDICHVVHIEKYITRDFT